MNKLASYEKHQFGKEINRILFASDPIRTVEYLAGRQSTLDRIEEALFASGRHIFIYGDRGVGKSSVGATAANLYQSSDADFIDISGSPDATLTNIIANIGYQAVNADRLLKHDKETIKKWDFKYLNLSERSSSSIQDLGRSVETILDAVEVLKEVAKIHSEKPIILIDEFDRVPEVERIKFADLLKQIGDKGIDVKFIFTGVAQSLTELLGAHDSAARQLDGIELEKLSWDARADICNLALAHFDIEIPRSIYFRIGAVSDGYPHYIHLITEKILWHLYRSGFDGAVINKEHYQVGLRNAISSIDAIYKDPYETVIHQKTGDFEAVLWATADSEWLQRYLKDMYTSYLNIIKQIPEIEPLKKTIFDSRIRRLTSDSLECVLQTEQRPGLYSYKTKMLRGFVRMQAEANGIKLGGEEQKAEKQYMHTGATVNRGYNSRIPKGVDMNRKLSFQSDDETD